jgi:hypothetical protein
VKESAYSYGSLNILAKGLNSREARSYRAAFQIPHSLITSSAELRVRLNCLLRERLELLNLQILTVGVQPLCSG